MCSRVCKVFTPYGNSGKCEGNMESVVRIGNLEHVATVFYIVETVNSLYRCMCHSVIGSLCWHSANLCHRVWVLCKHVLCIILRCQRSLVSTLWMCFKSSIWPQVCDNIDESRMRSVFRLWKRRYNWIICIRVLHKTISWY